MKFVVGIASIRTPFASWNTIEEAKACITTLTIIAGMLNLAPIPHAIYTQEEWLSLTVDEQPWRGARPTIQDLWGEG